MATEGPQPSSDAAAAAFLHSINLPFFLPVFLGLSTSAPSSDHSGSPPERFVLVNPFTQSMIVLGAAGLDPRQQSLMGGRPPASRASIEAMPDVEVEEGRECECAICLESLAAGESAKETPCKHRFHGRCIERWLGLHGTCPVCRYEMPVEEGEAHEKRAGGVWASFALGVGGGHSDDSVSSSS